MPRTARDQSATGIYHVMIRGICGFKGFTVSRFQGFHDLVRKFGKIFLFIYDITYLLFYYILK